MFWKNMIQEGLDICLLELGFATGRVSSSSSDSITFNSTSIQAADGRSLE
jgi:hypothetical protein